MGTLRTTGTLPMQDIYILPDLVKKATVREQWNGKNNTVGRDELSIS